MGVNCLRRPALTRFGDKLTSLRVRAGMTQEQLAGKAGMLRTTVVNMEGGRQWLTVESLCGLCSALRCKPGDLLDGVCEEEA